MASVLDLIGEIDQCAAYIAQQQQMNLPGVDVGAMQESLATSMATSIARLRSLNADGALRLSSALANSGYTIAGRSLVANAIRSKHEATDAIVSGATTQFQTLIHIENYLTEADWAFIEHNEHTRSQKINRMAWRLSQLRIKHPSKDTIKYGVAALALLAFRQFPSYPSIYDMTIELHSEIVSAQGPPDIGQRIFPEYPAMLSHEVLEAAYPLPDDQPVCKSIDKLTVIAEKYTPIRKNNKLLKQPNSQCDNQNLAITQRGVPSASSPLHQQNLEASIQNQLGNFMHAMAANFGFQLPQPEPRITVNVPPRSGSATSGDSGSPQELFTACRRNASRVNPSHSFPGVVSPESERSHIPDHVTGTPGPHTPPPLHRGTSSGTVASAEHETASHHPPSMPSLAVPAPLHDMPSDAHAEARPGMVDAASHTITHPPPEFGAEFVGRSSARPGHSPHACGSGATAVTAVMEMEDAMLDALTKRDAHKAAERKVAKAAAAAAVLSASAATTTLPKAAAKVMGGAAANAAAVARGSRAHSASAAPPAKRVCGKTTMPSIAPMAAPTPPPSTFSNLGCSKCRWNTAGCAHCLRVALRRAGGHV